MDRIRDDHTPMTNRLPEEYAILLQAAYYGWAHQVAVVLRCHSAPAERRSLLRHADSDGDTALHRAALRLDPTIVRLLCTHGAVVDSRNRAGHTPLHLAALHEPPPGQPERTTETITILLDHGAAIDGRDARGWTALARAARVNRLDTMTLLLDRGADPMARSRGGDAALHERLRIFFQEQQHKRKARCPKSYRLSRSFV